MPRDGAATELAAYDFRRPNKFNRDHQRAVQMAAETFARHFTTTLSTSLRSLAHVQVRSIAQVTYDEYIGELPNPSYLAILSLEPLAGWSMLHLPLPIVMTAVDRLLGGTGSGTTPNRPLTDIEDGLVGGVLDSVLHDLAYALESLSAIDAALVRQESNPQYAQIASARDIVVVITFEVRIGGRTGDTTLCIPLASLQPALDHLATHTLDLTRLTAERAAVTSAVGRLLEDADVEVSVRFADVRLASGEIVDLHPGDVLSLDHPVDRPLSVTVGGVPRFSAVPGRRGKRLACVLVEPAHTVRNS